MTNNLKHYSCPNYIRECEITELSKIQNEIEVLMSNWFDSDINLNFATLAIIEVLANVFEHGFDQSEQNHPLIQLEISRTNVTIFALITDNGLALPHAVLSAMTGNNLNMPSINVEQETLPESGWGLNLVQHATRAVTYQRKSDFNYLELTFDCMAEL